MPFDENLVVGVVGAGAMGTGIAQVAAAAGHRVILGDAAAGAATKAHASIAKVMTREVEKGRLTRDAADALLARVEPQSAALANELGSYAPCGLVIEAVVEDLGVKRQLFAALDRIVAPAAVLATNTSSLSVASI